MIDSEQEHPYVEWIAREARRPVVTDQAARARIMAAVRAEPLPSRRRQPSVWRRFTERRALMLSPMHSGLIAAGLVGVGIALGFFTTNNRDVRSSVGQPPVAVAPPQLPVPDTVVAFSFAAPYAAKVSLVGDFNGWDASKTPMVRTNHGLWTTAVPLTSGRHLYAFVVNGKEWDIDPSALLAPDDGFGHPNSVRLVSRGSAL